MKLLNQKSHEKQAQNCHFRCKPVGAPLYLPDGMQLDSGIAEKNQLDL